MRKGLFRELRMRHNNIISIQYNPIIPGHLGLRQDRSDPALTIEEEWAPIDPEPQSPHRNTPLPGFGETHHHYLTSQLPHPGDQGDWICHIVKEPHRCRGVILAFGTNLRK